MAGAIYSYLSKWFIYPSIAKFAKYPFSEVTYLTFTWPYIMQQGSGLYKGSVGRKETRQLSRQIASRSEVQCGWLPDTHLSVKQLESQTGEPFTTSQTLPTPPPPPPPTTPECEHLSFSSYFNPAPKMNPAPMQSGRVLLSPPYMITREVMLSVPYFGWFWPPRKSHANIIFRLLIKPEKLWTGINEMYFWLTPRTENICERKNNFTECERVWLRPKFRFKDMQIVVLDPPGTI